jgi:hypothetical protein
MTETKTKFAEFLATTKLDSRRLLAVSSQLEKHRPEDRAIRLAARLKRKNADSPAAKVTTGDKKKPRSGRPITPRAISGALVGKKLSGPQKSRLLKAVNHLLAQKKQEPVTLAQLF